SRPKGGAEMASSVRITGMGKLRSQLTRLAVDMSKAADRAEREAAEETKRVMQELVPVDSGRLRDAIRIQEGASGLEVGPGDEITYSMYVEYGTSEMSAQPYAGPAADVARSQFRDTVAETVRREI